MNEKPNDSIHEYFDPDTPREIRQQILHYHATACMSDAERARFLGLPQGCRIREGAKILSPTKLKIGINCWIGEGAILDASGGLEIGDNTSIGSGVFIWTHESYRRNIRGQNVREAPGITRTPTQIGSNCYIPGPSVIMPGVSVGNKCIIAPMSVVYEDLPDRTIYKPYKDFYDFTREKKQLYDSIRRLQLRVEQLESMLNKGL